MDIAELATYREGNRLEAKRALGRDGQGTLPRSVWETVSAFANTAGGVIVLGVSERPDGSLEPIGIPRADKVLDDFWNAALGDDKLSARLLCDEDASVEEVDGKRIVVIRVPWADRRVRPVYIDGDLFGGTFRRAHTGDHRCSREEVLSMLRDSDTSSQDAQLAERAKMSWLDADTVARYRRRFDTLRPGHAWADLPDVDFLVAIGAARDEGGGVRPTRAGLLMFGLDRWIIQEFPHYLLDYRQETGAERWEDRLASFTGDWTGNVYDFFFRVYGKLSAALKVPFKLSGIDRDDDTLAHKALREALANCLTNANWFERRGVVCVWRPDCIEISNPGDFRMPIEEAMKPGSSDPRNEVMLRMFSMINIGERAGSGLDELFRGWQTTGHGRPSFDVAYGPDRTTLTLPLEEDVGVEERALGGNEQAALRIAAERGRVRTKDVVEATGLTRRAATSLLRRLEKQGRLTWHGSSRNDPSQHYTAD